MINRITKIWYLIGPPLCVNNNTTAVIKSPTSTKNRNTETNIRAGNMVGDLAWTFLKYTTVKAATQGPRKTEKMQDSHIVVII